MGSVCSQEEKAEGAAPRRTAPTEGEEKSGTPTRLSYTLSGRRDERSSSVTRRKVFSLSGMGRDTEARLPRKVNKSDDVRRLVRRALQEGTVLSALNAYELDEMIDFMDVVPLKSGQECDLTGSLCVVVDGAVLINPQATESKDSLPDRFTAGQVFGQVGLFHDGTAVSAGGLIALADGATRICKLNGSAYRAGMEFSRQAQIKANMKLLSSIPMFGKMSVSERVRSGRWTWWSEGVD